MARRLSHLLAELKRRHVFRASVVYALAASAVVAFANDAFPHLGLPSWTITAVVLAAVAGLPIIVALAWAFDLSGLRVERTRPPKRPLEEAAPPPTLAESCSIAVLPFADVSPGKDQEYFSDGLTEELLNLLGKMEGLSVVARTSSFSFKGKNVQASEVGQQLGVATLLEGSVRTYGDRLRIAARLTEARTGYSLWSESYDRDMRDVFALQDEIAGAIVQKLKPKLIGGSGAHISATPTRSVAAYQSYLRGRYNWHQKSVPALQKACELFTAAIREDPTYAPAYAGLADSYLSLVDVDAIRTDEFLRLDKAEAAASDAIRLDDDLADGHASLGHLFIHRWEWTRAEREFRRAIALNPSYLVANQYYAILLALTRRPDEAVEVIRRAQQLDPLSLAVHGTAGYLLYQARRFEEAEQQLRDVVQLDPSRDGPHMRLGMVLLQLDRPEEALDHLQQAMRLKEGLHPLALPLTGCAHLRAGRPAEAEGIHQRVREELKVRRVSQLYSAGLLAQLGEKNAALEILEDLAETRHSALVDLAVEPLLDPLRSDPRFDALVNRVGFSPYVASRV